MFLDNVREGFKLANRRDCGCAEDAGEVVCGSGDPSAGDELTIRERLGAAFSYKVDVDDIFDKLNG